MSHFQLDAKHMFCPMPVIRTQDKIKELEPDDILEVVSTDPGALNDISAWSRINGHIVLEAFEKNNEYIVKIQVGNT